MEEKRYCFEEFAPRALEFMDIFNDYPDELDDEFDIERALNRCYRDIEEYKEQGVQLPYIQHGRMLYRTALLGNKEQLGKYLSNYFDDCSSYYGYFEYEYYRFGSGFYRFSVFNPTALYLCAKYFDSIGDTEKADKSYYFLNCLFSYEPVSDYVMEFLSDSFERIKRFIFPDWETVNPNITFQIGTYYKEKEQYDKAGEWFELGSELDYEGRQSTEPFINVSKNEYELGLLYLNGLGVEEDVNLALEYFQKAANNCGHEYLPIIGDMYLDGKIEIDEDEDANEEALYAYSDVNTYIMDRYCYLDFIFLSEEQEERLKKLLSLIEQNEENLTYGICRCLENVYKYRFYNEEKAKFYKQKREEMMKNR